MMVNENFQKIPPLKEIPSKK